MADEPGRRSLGFSVTPEPVTVVTDQGATVTLVDAGDFIIDSFYTRCGISEDGHYYPIVVNESISGAAIGSNWEPDTGGNPNAPGIDYVKIIDSNDQYVNPQLLPWLAKQGATVQKTFQDCYMKPGQIYIYRSIQSFMCYQGTTLATSPNIVDPNGVQHPVRYTTHDGEFAVNCNADGFSTTAYNPFTVRCSNNPEIWEDYCNYCLLKALGAPTTIFES